jgi:hypothetical protein
VPTAFWEAIFMLVVLKIPIVYLCIVVWWAIRAEPRPLEGAARLARLPEPPPRHWRPRSSGGRPSGFRSGPARSYARRAAPAPVARVRRTGG